MCVVGDEPIAMFDDDTFTISSSNTREYHLSRGRGIDLASIGACKVYAFMIPPFSIQWIYPLSKGGADMIPLIPERIEVWNIGILLRHRLDYTEYRCYALIVLCRAEYLMDKLPLALSISKGEHCYCESYEEELPHRAFALFRLSSLMW